MNEAEIRQCAGMWALVAEMNGIVAEIEAMKRKNIDDIYFGENHFWNASMRLHDIANRLRTEV